MRGLKQIDPNAKFPGCPTDKRYERKFRYVKPPKKQAVKLFNTNLLIQIKNAKNSVVGTKQSTL